MFERSALVHATFSGLMCDGSQPSNSYPFVSSKQSSHARTRCGLVNQHFERIVLGRVGEHIVCSHHLIKRELVRDELIDWQ